MSKVHAFKSATGKVGYRIVGDAEELAPGEIEVEGIAEDQAYVWSSGKVWDDTLEGPRQQTETEVLEEKRKETELRIAMEAQVSLTGPFVNSDEVIGLLASAMYKTQEGEPLDQTEAGALNLLHGEYIKAQAKKERIKNTTSLEDLDEITWKGE